MAVFRIEKTRDYTVMSNHHLRNKDLSLKAKGLLSLMLSLPEDWDYTTKGLAKICKDGVDSICSCVKELEQQGYIVRERVRNEKGQLTNIEYTILEQPKAVSPKQDKPKRENPVLDNPTLEKPILENPAQLNTNISKTNLLNKDLSSMYESNPIQSNQKESAKEKLKQQNSDGIGTDKAIAYKDLIKSNIEYDIMCERYPQIKIDEIVDLLTETVCTAKRILTIAGDDYPAEIVKSKLLKLDSGHIEYVIDCMKENTTDIRNIKKYLLAALFNAPSTIDSYFTAKVNHDMKGGGYD